jgi:osmoprotectant transport system substrate-binding protein
MRRWAAAAVATCALLIAGCGSDSPASVGVGAGPTPESGLLAHLYAAALRYHGSAAHVEQSKDPLGDLDAADVEVVPGLTGHLLRRFEPGAVARGDEQVYRTMISALPEGITAGDYAQSAADKPAPAVLESTAKNWGGRDVTTLVAHCPTSTVGAIAGTNPPAVIGTCKLPAVREYPDAAALFDALRSGRIQLAWTSTAAPNVPDDVTVLADRTALIRAENVVPLYRRNELTDQEVLALNEIAGELDTGALADMLRQVSKGADPGTVVAGWLADHPLGH